MKKLLAVLLVFASTVLLNGCGDEDVVNNNPVTTTKGVFVLYEGVFGQPQSYDYGFIYTDSGTVNANVYQNSNGGANLNSVPNGMILNSLGLFVVAQGNYGGAGTIYKINPSNNQLIASRNFGTNPYSLDFGQTRIYITNTASDYVSVLDHSFNPVADSISVGPNPSEIAVSSGNVFVAKQSYTFENSLAVINESNLSVTKIFFNTPPVCVEKGENRIFVSTYSGKKIYSILPSNAVVIDSADVPVNEPAIGTIAAMDSHTLFVLGVADTSFGSNIGKRVYKFDVLSKTLDPNFNIQFSGSDDAYGISFNSIQQKLYIANSKGGQVNGEVRVYDISGNLLTTYADIGGKFPKRLVFEN